MTIKPILLKQHFFAYDFFTIEMKLQSFAKIKSTASPIKIQL